MFLTRRHGARGRTASMSDRSPWGDFWFSPVGALTAAGVRITSDSALALPTAWACVRNISEDFAKLPVRVFRRAADGSRVQLNAHWLQRLLARQPNNWQTPFEWREMLQGHLLLRGNAFCQIIDDGTGGIDQLIPLHPDRVQIELLDNGSFRYRYTDRSGQITIFRRDQLWHLRGLSPDGYVGYNPVQLQRMALGANMAAQEYSARFFANDARPVGGWIEFPGSFADQTARQNFTESWQRAQGGMRQGRTAVLDKGMKYHEVGINNKDSQFIETQQQGAVGVCSIFRVPPHKVGILDKATFSNIEQQNIEYATDTMQSWCERWESSIECTLLGPDVDLEVEFNLAALMRGDSISRATRAATLVNAGVLTRNEARADEGLNPIDGLDEPLRPLNMVEEHAADAGDPSDPAAPAAPQPAPAPSDPTDSEDMTEQAAERRRLQALLIGNAARIARRVASGRAPDAAVIADALAVSPEAAARWLASPQWETEPQIATSLLGLALSGEPA